MNHHKVIIVGAGPAGLACAGALKMLGLPALVLEKGPSLGTVWRQHYDRLHLHTAKQYSGLPGFPMPKTYPSYPSRGQVVDYLETYAEHFGISPVCGVEVTRITKDETWEVETTGQIYTADQVIVACGAASFPHLGKVAGLSDFGGDVLHSSAYKNADPFSGKRVLVVGFGNSGGEIAPDLAEAGVPVSISVRSAVNIIPRDILGIPAQSFSIAERHIPPKLADLLNSGITRLRTGDITKLGLKKSEKGPVTQIVEDKRIPLIDIGTLAAIRSGLISVYGRIDRVESAQVHFEDGQTVEFDVILLATGFRPDLRDMLPDLGSRLDENGAPRLSGADSLSDGLAFCGYKVAPTGYLREIRLEAEAISHQISV